MSAPYLLEDKLTGFPPADHALDEPNGLLAIGGDLSATRLLQAYRQGIFPWYEEGQPILWWSPDPRTVLYPQRVKVSRSLKQRIRQGGFHLTFDQAFERVIQACAAPRDGSHGTWITPQINHAYIELHQLGHAHSIEVWRNGNLTGGLYGIAIGSIFFGESMFSHESDASKIALVTLCRQLEIWKFPIIDCQVDNPHLFKMGAEMITRRLFLQTLKSACEKDHTEIKWDLNLSAAQLQEWL